MVASYKKLCIIGTKNAQKKNAQKDSNNTQEQKQRSIKELRQNKTM